MKVLIYGAGGMIGSRIAAELLARGHQVTAGIRTADRASGLDPRLTSDVTDVTDAASVARAAVGHDAVVSAVGAPYDGSASPTFQVETVKSLVEGLRNAGVSRLALVGGAGSLEVAPGIDLVDTPEFPALWKSNSLDHREELRVIRTVDDVDWVYLSPAALIEPGERTGIFRTGGEQLLVDGEGNSRISAEDFAVALADLLESGQPVRTRITVAY